MYGHPSDLKGHARAVNPRSECEANECLCMGCKSVGTDRKRMQAALDDASRRLCYWIAALAAVALLSLLLLVPRSAAAIELFASAGEARYQRCERAGCWKQSPLPYEFNQSTGAAAIGVRLGAWEIAARDLGRVGVYGFFVADHEYDPQEQSLRVADARLWRGNVQQSTQGLSLIYAPRWQFGRADLTAGAGVLVYRSHVDVAIDYTDGGCCSTHLRRADVRVTPAFSLAVGYRITHALAVAVKGETFWRVNYHDLPLGGTESTKKPGVMVWSLALRWAL